MKKIKAPTLTEQAVQSLLKIAPRKTYSADAPLHYAGQTPIVAYCIVKGHVILTKGKRTHRKLSPGSLLGYHEFQANIPINYTAMATNNSEIVFLDKSTLMEIRNSSCEEMSNLYTELSQFNP